ncbi:ferredoxin reductase [Zavarzinia compransoris]|uniref:ferredoxin reductase n=1 Tax=Zavarzinia marina TaxID=2911065 RepID=UPI001F220BED|nr:ferredoxin reductase [Zavarzinia marina]MCF4166609.1 ferredoxin reductase [Zavarzinia marina]
MPRTATPMMTRVNDVLGLFFTPLKASHYLELVNPLWTTHRLQARIEAVWDETADSRTLTLRPGAGWRSHRAGQYIRLGVESGGLRHTRTYSISSAPERADGCITVTVKAIPGGRVSRHLVRDARPGDFLPVGLPQGDFIMPDAMPTRPLFITAGSGITPVMAMLRSAALRERMPDVVHIHYAPHAHDVIFGHEMRKLASTYPHYRLNEVHTRDVADSAERHFGAAQLDALCPDWRERDVWCCGPAGLLDAVEAHWQAAGLARRLHVERFRAALAPADPDARGGTVAFSTSGGSATADGATPLLRVAEDAGLNPAHGCRMGICHGCDATLVSGCVRDLRTGALLDEPGEKIQVCVCAAAGDCTLAL